MDFGLNEEQETLQRYAREFFEKECTSAFVRKMAFESETAYDEGFYKHMSELGWTGLVIPEEYGGQGSTYVELSVLLEEMGRAVAPGPFFATVCLAAPIISSAATSGEQRKALLSPIASGSARATVAYTEEAGRVDASGVQLRATKDGDGFVLSGTKSYVPDAHVADILVVAARTSDGDRPEDGITLFAFEPGVGTDVSQLETMDMTRRWCEVTFNGVRVTSDQVLGEVDKGWAPLSEGLLRATSMLSAESVGGAGKVMDMAVDYAKNRIQFGRPIGSFQAVKHKCADMLVDVEMSRSAMYYAAWACSDSPAELPLAASTAKAYCSDAFTRVAAAGIQVHGGIGFTWEHDMHIYFKRAKANEILLGDPTYHREVVASLVA